MQWIGADLAGVRQKLNGAVVALDAVNSPKDFMGGRALVQERLRVPPELLADTAVPVRQIVKQLVS